MYSSNITLYPYQLYNVYTDYLYSVSQLNCIISFDMFHDTEYLP